MSRGLSEDFSACFGGTIVSLRLIFNCAGVDGSGALSPDSLFDLLGCCVALAFEMSGDKNVFRLRFAGAGSDDIVEGGKGSVSMAFFVCSCFERVRLKRKPLSSSSYAIISQKGNSTKFANRDGVAEGLFGYGPHYSIAFENTYMASSFDHPCYFCDRSFGSFPVLPQKLRLS